VMSQSDKQRMTETDQEVQMGEDGEEGKSEESGAKMANFFVGLDMFPFHPDKVR